MYGRALAWCRSGRVAEGGRGGGPTGVIAGARPPPAGGIPPGRLGFSCPAGGWSGLPARPARHEAPEPHPAPAHRSPLAAVLGRSHPTASSSASPAGVQRSLRFPTEWARDTLRWIGRLPSGGTFNVGQNYGMNDYLRMAHPGQAVAATSGGFNGWAGANPGLMGAWYSGANPDFLQPGPAEVVLLYEQAQFANGGNNRNGSPFFNSGASATPPLCVGMPQNYHAGRSNFLYCDGHVNSMVPGTTRAGADRPAFQSFNSNCPTPAAVLATGQYTGSAPVMQWNPQMAGMVYP